MTRSSPRSRELPRARPSPSRSCRRPAGGADRARRADAGPVLGASGRRTARRRRRAPLRGRRRARRGRDDRRQVAALLRDGLSPDDVRVVVPSPEAVLAGQAAAFEASVCHTRSTRACRSRVRRSATRCIGLCRFAWRARHARASVRMAALARLRAARLPTVDRGKAGARERAPEAARAYEIAVRDRRAPCPRSRPACRDDPVGALREVLDQAPGARGVSMRACAGSGEQAASGARVVGGARRAATASTALILVPASGDEVIGALETPRCGSATTAVAGACGSWRSRAHARIVSRWSCWRASRRASCRARVRARGGLRTEGVRACARGAGVPLVRRDDEALARYLVTAAVASATRQLVLVRRAVGEDGGPLAPGPVWNAALEVLAGRGTGTRAAWHRRAHVRAARGPERARAPARPGCGRRDRPAAGARIAGAQGPAWSRRIERARHAFSRSTKLLDRRLLADVVRAGALLGKRARGLHELLGTLVRRAGAGDPRRSRPRSRRWCRATSRTPRSLAPVHPAAGRARQGPHRAR